MAEDIVLDLPLRAADIAAIAGGAKLVLSAGARERISRSRELVDAIVDRGIRGYGINTGVGALCEVIIDREQQSRLSHNILFSHACGVGTPLPENQARAVMAAQINNFAHGYSGIRLEVVETLVALLNAGVIPVIPSRGSLGYITHAAAIGLVVIGHGAATFQSRQVSGAEALEIAGLSPLTLGAKEGLSLVNGSPCTTGLTCVALDRAMRLLDWADAAAAFTYGVLGRQQNTFADEPMRLRKSPGLWETARHLREGLTGTVRNGADVRTQDPMSIRAVPQIHGAIRDSLATIAETAERELASVTDNPLVKGSPEEPVVYSQAHALSTTLAFAMDQLAIVTTQLGIISERRTDRLVNPLVSGLPAFLSGESGVGSGFMIAQYTAVSLCGENRRLSAPASIDGGITSALQEDVLPHSTPAAEKALRVLDNLETVIAIELLCAAQAYDLSPDVHRGAPLTRLYNRIRDTVPHYADDRPLNTDFARIASLVRTTKAGLFQSAV
ncbi:histidine ammonia-lyase [Agrobacterium tumefaciens]|nr:histidine ammonia-lyase [Agrobacterium tumefaciens]